MKDLLKSLFKGKPEDTAPSYEEAKELARHEDADVRRSLAAQPGVQPEILYFLAEDPEPAVRRAIATNESTPVQADLMLASDADEGVRGDLAAKVATLAPGLTADEQDRLRAMAFETLETLARDQAVKVRQILSEALKDVAHAPPEVIRQLAWDAEEVVAGPVLQYSPVLTEDDLMEIIESNPTTARLGAVAQRSQVSATLADIIVAADDDEAMALLLGNHDALIREETLDRIVDRAMDIEPWHEPLVERPILPARAAAKLARFVAHNLLKTLGEREDLEPEALAEVRAIVERRLADEPPEPEPAGQSTAEEAMAKAKVMKDSGTLNEAAVADAVGIGDRELVIAQLTVAAGLKVATVRRAVDSRSAKGVAAVAWKAGLGAALAETIQTKVALVPAKDVLRAQGGAYPLDEDALEWQLDFLKDMG